MSDRAFIDTNIWFYAFVRGNSAEETHKNDCADKLIKACSNIIISIQIINELSVNLLRKAAYSESRLKALISAFYRRYTVAGTDQDTLLCASSLRETLALSYWDSLVVASALESNCTTLYTEDMQHGQVIQSVLTIRNPFAG